MARGRRTRRSENSEEETSSSPVPEPQVSAEPEPAPASDNEEEQSSDENTTETPKELRARLLKEFDETVEANKEKDLTLSKKQIAQYKDHIKLQASVLALSNARKALPQQYNMALASLKVFFNTANSALRDAEETMAARAKADEKNLPAFHAKHKGPTVVEKATSKELKHILGKSSINFNDALSELSSYLGDVKKNLKTEDYEVCRQKDKKLKKLIPDDKLREYIIETNKKVRQKAEKAGEEVDESKIRDETTPSLTHKDLMHFIAINLTSV
jgi:hypothetical protein